MRKIILELTTETDDSLFNILWDLEREINCACRKLHKLGFVRKDGEYWTKDEVKE